MDHRMILSKDDPILPMLNDINEPVYVLDDNPTAENIAKHIHEQARKAGNKGFRSPGSPLFT